MQKESFFREILSEAQMYKMSADRLAYARNYDLVTLQQQELIKQMRQQNDVTEEETHKLPNLSYGIEHLQMFEYSGVTYFVVAFQNKSVQVFDLNTNESFFEFDFNQRPAH